MTLDTSEKASTEGAPSGFQLAVSVVARRESRFLLVERAKNPGRGMYAFPGGKVEEGEALEEAARRELFEETGLSANGLSALTKVTVQGSQGGFLLHVFLAGSVSGGLKAGDDALSAGWFSLDDMHALAVPHSVRDVALMVSGTDL